MFVKSVRATHAVRGHHPLVSFLYIDIYTCVDLHSLAAWVGPTSDRSWGCVCVGDLDRTHDTS